MNATKVKCTSQAHRLRKRTHSNAMTKLLHLVLLLIPAAALPAGEILAVAHPDEALTTHKTVVWTPLFQAAWDALHEGRGAPIRVEPPNALMDRLDHFKWSPAAVMPREGWKVWSGHATQQLIHQANEEAARMLGQTTGPFQMQAAPDSRIALGLLDRDMVFKKPLHRSLNSSLGFTAMDGSHSQVRFFGTRGTTSAGYSGVVRVLANQDMSHALQIASSGDDSAVLYLPESPVTFSVACAKLREWRENPLKGPYGSAQDPWLHENDDVRIPLLELENTTDFVSDLKSDRYFRTGPPWYLHKAEQRLKFKLTEKGARLRVKVEVAADPFGELPPKPEMVPRLFRYDRPFYVFLWRDGAEWPYFGTWIGNDQAMVNFPE
jgi:hypothetical protein